MEDIEGWGWITWLRVVKNAERMVKWKRTDGENSELMA